MEGEGADMRSAMVPHEKRLGQWEGLKGQSGQRRNWCGR